MYQALQVMVQQVLGQLAWDLLAKKTYAPNTELVFTLQVTNPTSGDRAYKLQAQAIVGGQLAWYADLLLGLPSDPWFQVPAGKTAGVQGTFSADQTNFTFQVLLIDQVTNTTVAQVKTELVGTAAPPTTPPTTPTTPAPATNILSSILPLMSLALVMGLMSSLTGVFREKERGPELGEG